MDDNGFIGKQYERKGIVMNILIIGYGSIGKRHEEVLTSINKNFNIHIVTKQDIKDKVTYKNLQDIKDVSVYDYFIIASETYKHFEQLKFLNSRSPASNPVYFACHLFLPIHPVFFSVASGQFLIKINIFSMIHKSI